MGGQFFVESGPRRVAEPAVDQQFVGCFEHGKIYAGEPVVAPAEQVDVVGREGGTLGGDLDVLTPLVSGPSAMGDAQNRQLSRGRH